MEIPNHPPGSNSPLLCKVFPITSSESPIKVLKVPRINFSPEWLPQPVIGHMFLRLLLVSVFPTRQYSQLLANSLAQKRHSVTRISLKAVVSEGKDTTPSY